MAPITSTEEITSPLPASRLFKALFLDTDTLLPKVVPQAFKNVEVIEGNGGPGTIKQMNFAEGTPFKYVKHRIDAVDKEKMAYAYTLIEGDALLGKIDSIVYSITFESTPNGGCVVKTTSIHHTKPGVELKEEEIKAGKDIT